MMTLNEFRSLFHNGLIKQNTGLVQLLGLCPLLAISNNVINALSLGLATTLVMAASSGAVSSVRHFVPNEIRIPVFVLIIAALVTVIDLAMNAFVHPLYLVLGIFIPLITTNCIVMARADAFAAKNRPLHSVVDAIAMGLGLTLVLVVLGAIRVVFGALSEWWGGRRGAASVGVALGLASAPVFLFSSSAPGLLTGAWLIGFLASGAWGIVPGYLSERFPTEARGVGTGFSYHVGVGFGALAPYLIGAMLDGGLDLRSAMLRCILGAGVAVLILLWLGPETRGRSLH